MSQRILIVEPEPHAREGLRAILAGVGHEVVVAADIPGGFEHLTARPFDVLLLDADLSRREVVLSVLDLLRLARMRDERASGVLLTSSVEDLPNDLASEGVVAVLERPVELARLRQALETAGARSARAGKARPSRSRSGEREERRTTG